VELLNANLGGHGTRRILFSCSRQLSGTPRMTSLSVRSRRCLPVNSASVTCGDKCANCRILSLAKILSAPKMAGFCLHHSVKSLNSAKICFREWGFSWVGACEGTRRTYILRMDEKSVPTRQLDRNGDATRRDAREKECDPWVWNASCCLVFPSRVRDACGLRHSSRRSQRAAVSDGVHSAE
jgi:hypothetical protein